MCKSRKEVSAFSLEGQIVGSILEDGYKLVYLRIAAPSGEEYVVKISKELRSPLTPIMYRGLTVRVVGEKKLNLDSGKIKLKAYSITPLAGGNLPAEERHSFNDISVKREASALPLSCSGQSPILPCQGGDSSSEKTATATANCPQAKAKILVCQKSDCQKRGGRAVCQALENALSDRGLKDQVTIQGTGCLKQCKAGPNIVLMPDKTRYSRIEPAEIPAIIEKHFAVNCY
ncbi:(2Fe-2S) ferredoxin domain-containing protein [Kamptonema sp. UHCC 0994]|uniref:(2Fe-2S) ferredoxin domain-containing protein n=1 Tax=Kamptonema sp. UHCC 0994 TaxID=3031329 RepID=UPI0023B99F1B|nr:(2Fe-2S) ferredoxin domain-containing protein [Kamptonema sp. UHCC 0994]MDF0555530.1 (2Fe-2S) ferredoxin domain-containing protein [Kamptonema sp. UHCC 0994]